MTKEWLYIKNLMKNKIKNEDKIKDQYLTRLLVGLTQMKAENYHFKLLGW